MNGFEEATISSVGATCNNRNESKEEEKNESNTCNKVPFYKIFSLADSTNKVLMFIGSIGAIANGVAMPLMAILLGDLVNAFGQNQNTREVIHVVSQVQIYTILLSTLLPYFWKY